ncbi:MAG: hypothetical protein HKN42_19605 [Granulosicoccus sp.]|nr:hypothetical protein [Granulosicoccus sp.]
MMTQRIKALALLCLAFTLLSANAQAEFFGLPNGRSANPGTLSRLSVELGFVTGDLGRTDFQNIGARVNFRVAPEIVVIGDIGASEYGNADGTPIGIGIFYHLANQRISDQLDIAAKASYHTGDYKYRGAGIDLSGLSFEALFSGRAPLSDNGLGWYANLGFHRLTVDSGFSDSSNEIGFGGGLVLPTLQGEAYVGMDLIDELTFGLGFRYFLN